MREKLNLGLVSAIAAASTALLLSAPTVGADPIAATALVLRVVDGDTIDIRDDNRGRLRVRVLGIDTPETKKPGYTGAGDRRRRSSPSRPWWGNGLRL
jgi:endonuclease YncB( thermonuclease family)